MESYILCKPDSLPGLKVQSVIRASDGASIVCDDQRNTDYQKFLQDMASGAVLTNPDGSPATYTAS